MVKGTGKIYWSKFGHLRIEINSNILITIQPSTSGTTPAKKKASSTKVKPEPDSTPESAGDHEAMDVPEGDKDDEEGDMDDERHERRRTNSDLNRVSSLQFDHEQDIDHQHFHLSFAVFPKRNGYSQEGTRRPEEPCHRCHLAPEAATGGGEKAAENPGENDHAHQGENANHVH